MSGSHPPYPGFFEAVPRLRVRDPLAEFLGASGGGILDYGYPDAVRLAGHSCPTVASAYWLTHQALGALYGEALPERGAIKVEFREAADAGVTGVIANVVSMLTGATANTGFKGLAGRFDRRHLLYFDVPLPLEIRFTRLDTQAKVDVAANTRSLPSDPSMTPLMQRCLRNEATPAEQQQFGLMWQERVRCMLLDHRHDANVFIVRPVTE